jgi:hypothetical protein
MGAKFFFKNFLEGGHLSPGFLLKNSSLLRIDTAKMKGTMRMSNFIPRKEKLLLDAVRASEKATIQLRQLKKKIPKSWSITVHTNSTKNTEFMMSIAKQKIVKPKVRKQEKIRRDHEHLESLLRRMSIIWSTIWENEICVGGRPRRTI